MSYQHTFIKISYIFNIISHETELANKLLKIIIFANIKIVIFLPVILIMPFC